MKDRAVAKTYAKALKLIEKEQKTDSTGEMKKVWDTIYSNEQLESLLFLNIFSIEEKTTVLMDVLNQLNSPIFLRSFFQFLISEKRIGLFPQIYCELMALYDEEQGIIRGTIVGRDEKIDDVLVDKIVNFLEKELKKKPILSYRQDDRISAGHIVTAGEMQLDASIDGQLQQLKRELLARKK